RSVGRLGSTSPITGGILIFNANMGLQTATKCGFHQPRMQQSVDVRVLTWARFYAKLINLSQPGV
ncbi:MAG: hypothetical protein WC641_05945, partial [Patescibacteria group bacterium]